MRGTPVLALGVIVYGILCLTSIAEVLLQKDYRWLDSSTVASAVLVGMAAAWFVCLQLFVIRQVCLLCMTVNGAGILICLLIAHKYWKQASGSEWGIDRSVFESFERWLVDGRRPPPFHDARNKAYHMVDSTQLSLAMMSSQVSDKIQRSIKVFQQSGVDKMPQVLMKHKLATGRIASVRELQEVLKAGGAI